MINMTNVAYLGNVKIRLKIKDKIFEIINHNEGLPELSKSFAKFITGGLITVEDIPQYLDLRKYIDNNWQSQLNTRISLSGKYFDYDESIGNWVARLTGVISANYLSNPISRDDTSTYRLYLLSGSNPPAPLAFIEIGADTLSNLTPGTQAIIEWNMQLVNIETSE